MSLRAAGEAIPMLVDCFVVLQSTTPRNDPLLLSLRYAFGGEAVPLYAGRMLRRASSTTPRNDLLLLSLRYAFGGEAVPLYAGRLLRRASKHHSSQ